MLKGRSHMRLKIKLVIGITLVLIVMGLSYIVINTTMRYQREFGSVLYTFGELEEESEDENKSL
jgi:hypothetical protein